MTSNKETRNDIFTVCELLKKAYLDAVSPSNIIKGFSRSGIWNNYMRGPDIDSIRPIEYTSQGNSLVLLSEVCSTRSRTVIVESGDESRIRIESAKQLYNVFLAKSEKLVSDGTIEVNGTVCVTTKSGATLTSENVIAALKAAEERKKAEESRKMAAAEKRQRQRAERELASIAKKRKMEEMEEAVLQKLKCERARRRTKLLETRSLRREKTRRRVSQIQ